MRDSQAAHLDRGLRFLGQRTHAELVLRLGLTADLVPPELAHVEGNLGKSPVTMHTERYRGSHFAALTVALLEVEGQRCSLTVIALPHPGSGVPVLGIDLIALHGALSLVAIDLSPTDLQFHRSHCSPILDAVGQLLAPAVVQRRRPAFTEGAFSPQAIIAGGRAGQEETVFSAVELLLRRTGELLERTLPTSYSVAAAGLRNSWLTAERQNRKEHNALARMFGASFASQYLDSFLFGSTEKGQS